MYYIYFDHHKYSLKFEKGEENWKNIKKEFSDFEYKIFDICFSNLPNELKEIAADLLIIQKRKIKEKENCPTAADKNDNNELFTQNILTKGKAFIKVKMDKNDSLFKKLCLYLLNPQEKQQITLKKQFYDEFIENYFRNMMKIEKINLSDSSVAQCKSEIKGIIFLILILFQNTILEKMYSEKLKKKENKKTEIVYKNLASRAMIIKPIIEIDINNFDYYDSLETSFDHFEDFYFLDESDHLIVRALNENKTYDNFLGQDLSVLMDHKMNENPNIMDILSQNFNMNFMMPMNHNFLGYNNNWAVPHNVIPSAPTSYFYLQNNMYIADKKNEYKKSYRGKRRIHNRPNRYYPRSEKIEN